jgi:FkbM family methyltransferase
VLKLNYAAWGNCEHVAVAVGDQHDVSVTFAVHPDKTGGQHVASSTNESDWHHVQVLMQRIDRLIESGAVPLPDLVKMDIEGGEISALTGFGNHLSAPQAYVLETHSETLHRQCIEMLSEAGYWVASDTPRPGEARILCMIKS